MEAAGEVQFNLCLYPGSLNRGNQRKNAENVLRVKEIPCNNQITRLLDRVEPEGFVGNFKEGIRQAEEAGVLEQYRVLDGGVLIAVDGVWFQSPENARCERCLHISSNGKTRYYHSSSFTFSTKYGKKPLNLTSNPHIALKVKSLAGGKSLLPLRQIVAILLRRLHSAIIK
jgi:hypothetical protein